MARCWFVASLMRNSVLRCLLVVLASPAFLFAQNQNPVSDPQAVALAAQSIAAMTGGTAISDVTLNGSGSWTTGSNSQSVTVTLMAKGNNESRMNLQLQGGQQSEIRNNAAGPAQGEWLDGNGKSTHYSLQNCWTDPVWFFPILSSLNMTDPTTILTYVGVDNHQGTSVYHLRSYKNPSGMNQQMTTFVNSVSTVEFYLDSTSLLPVQITFNAHPDSDASTNIPVVLNLSNYTSVSGVRVPFRIQKSWNGNLLSDFTISSASFNSGLADSLFAIQ